jgi:hypothetical protein
MNMDPCLWMTPNKTSKLIYHRMDLLNKLTKTSKMTSIRAFLQTNLYLEW